MKFNRKKIMRYFIHLAYKGTHFNGWQIQPHSPSVQEEIQNGLTTLLKQKTIVVGCGRTDTGVHSHSFFAHFETSEDFDSAQLTYRLNKIISCDIAILNIFSVEEDMHARFSALSRTYTYSIHTVKNPFVQETSFYYPFKLDLEAMNNACKELFNHIDFTSFCKLHTDVNNNNCEIKFAEWTQKNDEITFTISANRFLRNMVRAITGTMLEIGRGKISVQDFREIIEKKDRAAAGMSVAAHGLSLIKIEYPLGFDKNKNV